MKSLIELFSFVSKILFPNLCVSCSKYLGNHAEVICNACYSNIPIESAFKCYGCKKRTPTISGKIRACKCGYKFIVGAPNHYSTSGLNHLITALKYKGTIKAAKPLGNLLCSFIKESKLKIANFIIIPVPLSKTREKERGYNQAELITFEFLKQITDQTLVYQKDVLKRTRDTLSQAKIQSYESRKNNLLNAFQVINVSLIKGKYILLIDDVITSGATAIEASNTLIKAGARKVIILTTARA